MRIACIGSGNMGLALMKGASGSEIGFSDVDLAKAEAAAEAAGAQVFSSNEQAASWGDFIFLAVKPQVLENVLRETAPVISGRLAKGETPVLVSMAAGWTIAKIKAVCAEEAKRKSLPVIRIMPNTPALISQGTIAWTPSEEVNERQCEEIQSILSQAGLAERIGENYLDAVTGLSGSGPAFVYQFIEALADGGVLAGLPRDRALRYAAKTVLGSAAMVLETGKHPGELKDMVCSPGGTTIAGVSALEDRAFRGAVIAAVEASWKRAKEMGD